MVMKGDTEVLRNYYLFTIPQVSVFVGAVLGVLFILKLDIHLSLGIFSFLYGLMLVTIHAVVFQHFRSNIIYRLGLFFSTVLILLGLLLIYQSVSNF